MTQQTTDLHTLGVLALSALLRERKLGAVEAAQHFLARAQAHQNRAPSSASTKRPPWPRPAPPTP